MVEQAVYKCNHSVLDLSPELRKEMVDSLFSMDHSSDDRAAIVGSVRDIWILPLSRHVVIFLVNGGGFTYHQNLVAMLPFALAKLELEEKMLAAVISHILSKEAR